MQTKAQTIRLPEQAKADIAAILANPPRHPVLMALPRLTGHAVHRVALALGLAELRRAAAEVKP